VLVGGASGEDEAVVTLVLEHLKAKIISAQSRDQYCAYRDGSSALLGDASFRLRDQDARVVEELLKLSE